MTETNECPLPEERLEEVESSGVEVSYEGEFRAITGVINLFEQSGDEIRAKLLKSLRETVRESEKTVKLAEQYVKAQDSNGR